MKNIFLTCFILIVFCFNYQDAFGQKNKKLKWIKIEHADRLENGYSPTGVEYQRLIKRVRFYHNGTRMWCDSAHYFARKNQFIAFGKIRIRQGDSINITAKNLKYDGKKGMAELRDEVIYKGDSVTLTTNHFDYDINNKLAYYFNGGKIVDNENTLTSQKGYFETDTKLISFKGDAIIVGIDATIKSDTLQYNSKNKITYFRGKTHISKDNGDNLITDKGEYGQNLENSIFQNATIYTNKIYQIQGDTLSIKKNNTIFNVKKNVILVQKKDSIVITGDIGYYNKEDSLAYVTGNVVFRKIFAKDTLYIKADTLKVIDNPIKIHKKISAYNNVLIMRKDLKAKTDSLIVNNYDSTIHLFTEPIVWKGEAQATAEKMEVKTANDNIRKIDLLNTAFLIAQDSISLDFNQLKGKNLSVYFKNNELDYADIYGNAENIYHISDNKKEEDTRINNMESKNMRITFKNGQLNAVKSYVNINGRIIPEPELLKDEGKLDNFDWKSEIAPKLEDFFPDGIPKLSPNLFADPLFLANKSQEILNSSTTTSPTNPSTNPSTTTIPKTNKNVKNQVNQVNQVNPTNTSTNNSTKSDNNQATKKGNVANQKQANKNKVKAEEVNKNVDEITEKVDKINKNVDEEKKLDEKNKSNQTKKSLKTKRKERVIRKKRRRLKRTQDRQKKMLKRKKRKKAREFRKNSRKNEKKAKREVKMKKKNKKLFYKKRNKLEKTKQKRMKKMQNKIKKEKDRLAKN